MSERGEIQRSETQGGGTGTEGEWNVPRPDRDNHSWATETSGLTGLAGFQVGKKRRPYGELGERAGAPIQQRVWPADNFRLAQRH